MKHCNCKGWKLNKSTATPLGIMLGFVQREAKATHCPFCGNALTLSYTITVYECFNPWWEDEPDLDNRKLWYNERKVYYKEYKTAAIRDAQLTKLKKQFTQPVHPTYTEVDHYLIMSGTKTTTGGRAMGAGEYFAWNGKQVQE